MSTNQKWKADLSDGHAGELAVATILRAAGFVVAVMNLPGHDLDARASIEVKRDRQTATTGNVAIETMHKGRQSGITVTTADVWAVVIGDAPADVLFVRTSVLRELVADLPDRPGGDGATVRLLPVATLKRRAWRFARFNMTGGAP